MQLTRVLRIGDSFPGGHKKEKRYILYWALKVRKNWPIEVRLVQWMDFYATQQFIKARGPVNVGVTVSIFLPLTFVAILCIFLCCILSQHPEYYHVHCLLFWTLLLAFWLSENSDFFTGKNNDNNAVLNYSAFQTAKEDKQVEQTKYYTAKNVNKTIR